MFHPIAKRIAVIMAAIVAAALLFGGVLIATAPKAATALCDVKSLRTMADDNPDQASYLRQEANVCEGKNADGSAKGSDEEAKAKTEAAKRDAAKKAQAAAEAAKQQRRQVFWLVQAPASTKISVNSFGPRFALEPSLAGRPLESLNLDELLVENRFRRSIDPSMTAAMGAFNEVGLWIHDEINAKTRVFAGDFAKWDQANTAVDTKLAALKAAGKLKLVSLPSGTYTATYELMAGDGMPNILKDENVQRSLPFAALQIGEEYGRIECSAGGQQYWPHSAGPKMEAMPEPSPGMTRTEEGTPTPVTPKPSPSTPGTPGTSTTPTGTPTTGTPTTGTPTTSVPSTTPGTPTSQACPPGKYWDTENHECLPNKGDGSNMPAPPANRDPAPAPNPSQAETVPPAPPATPANPAVTPGSGTTGQAPGAVPTAAPTGQQGAVPSGTNPSQPNTGDQDPDGN